MPRRSMITAAALTATLSLAACGDDDSPQRAGTSATASAGNPEAYCALTRQLDAAGEKFFAKLGEDARPEQYEAAERRFIEANADRLGEVERTAPAQIRTDVTKMLAAMRERGGLAPGMDVSEAEAGAAEKRVRAYERENCG